MEAAALKMINYRGGVVRFRIPSHWVEEYDDIEGGTFYDPGKTCTLRLSIVLYSTPPDDLVAPDAAAKALTPIAAQYGVQPVLREDGVAIARYDLPAKEQGHQLMIRFWTFGQALPPDHFRTASFSYTLLASEFEQPEAVAELALLDRELTSCEFASVVGEAPPPAKKPWYRFW
jgi:hypothetical protein